MYLRGSPNPRAERKTMNIQMEKSPIVIADTPDSEPSCWTTSVYLGYTAPNGTVQYTCALLECDQIGRYQIIPDENCPKQMRKVLLTLSDEQLAELGGRCWEIESAARKEFRTPRRLRNYVYKIRDKADQLRFSLLD